MPAETQKDHAFEEATAWFFRLQSNCLSEFERHAYDKWLSENPAHRQAMTEVESLLNALQAPAKNLRNRAQLTPISKVYKRRLFPPAFAKAAAVLLVCAALIQTLQPAILQNLQSDYHTATGEQRQIVLADGSRVLLNTDTAIRVDMQTDQRRIELLRGEAFFEVVHNLTRPFVINAGNVNAKDIGTAFSVSRINEYVAVSVTEGEVETAAEPTLDPAAILTPGKSAHYQANKLINLQTIDVRRELAWRDGRMVFVQATLGEIAAQINRYRLGKMVIVDAKLKQRRITAVFTLNRLDDAVDTLERSFGIRIRRLTDYFILIG